MAEGLDMHFLEFIFGTCKKTCLWQVATLTQADGKVVKEGKGDGRPLSVRKISTTTRKEVVEMWGCAAAHIHTCFVSCL